MTCKYSEKILLYFYGEMDNAQCKEIKEHLESCAECKKNLEVLRDVSGHLDSFKGNAPAHLIEGLIREARKREIWKFNVGNIFENIFSHWKVSASTLVFACLMFAVFFPFGADKDRLKWISNIDSDLDGLEYSMYEEYDFSLGEYGESVEDFEYENIDNEIESINKNRRIL